MDVTFLGTAAAEGWPAPFCLCGPCEEARRRGGPNIRMRSGVLIDDDLKIDFGPDTVAQTQRLGRTLARVRTVLITHQHSDHLTPDEFEWAVPPFTQTPPQLPLDVYANAQSVELITHAVARYPRLKGQLALHTISPGDRFTTATGDQVLVLAADHCENALLFRIKRAADGKVYLHGHDSDTFPAATLDALSDGVTIDVACFDCTNGPRHFDYRGHMDATDVIAMRDELRRRGALAPASRVIATHFSHNGGALHEELVRLFLPHQIEVAFDGMRVEV